MGELQRLAKTEHHPVRAVRNEVRRRRRDADTFVTVVVPETVDGGLFSYLLRTGDGRCC